MSKRNSRKRRLLMLATLLLCGVGVLQASASGTIADGPPAVRVDRGAAFQAIPATWSAAATESVSLAILGLTLLGASALLKRLLAPTAPPSRRIAPWIAEPPALQVRHNRPVRLRPLVNGRPAR